MKCTAKTKTQAYSERIDLLQSQLYHVRANAEANKLNQHAKINKLRDRNQELTTLLDVSIDLLKKPESSIFDQTMADGSKIKQKL